MLVKSSIAKYYYNLDSDKETSRLIATSAREIVSVMITAGGTSAAARLWDSASSTTGLNPTKSLLIAANAGESNSFQPVQPIPFCKGLYVVMEQGASQGAEVFIVYN